MYPMNRQLLSVAPSEKLKTGSKRKAAADATAESEGSNNEKKRTVRALKGEDLIALTDSVKRANPHEPAEAGASKKQKAAAAAVQVSASKAARSSDQVLAQNLRASHGLTENLTAILTILDQTGSSEYSGVCSNGNKWRSNIKVSRDSDNI